MGMAIVFRVALAALSLVLLPAMGGCATAAKTPKAIHVFNGKNLDGMYTFIKGRGKDIDPLKVFTVQDGALRISGEEMGCVTSNDEFQNYKVVMEFKWGEKTFKDRADKARDSGLLVHSTGADGAYGGIWMYSMECQMIEGGTGDLLVVADGSPAYSLTAPTAPELSHGFSVYQPGGKPVTFTKGRVNWFGRDPNWKDTKGFRGARDVEKPVGEWNTYECVADGDKLTLILNGVTVNACTDVRPTKGRIQIQSEGAELFVRKLDVIPLKPSATK